MALEDVQLMLRLAEALRGEPILISHLVRIFDREPGAPARLGRVWPTTNGRTPN